MSFDVIFCDWIIFYGIKVFLVIVIFVVGKWFVKGIS